MLAKKHIRTRSLSLAQDKEKAKEKNVEKEIY